MDDTREILLRALDGDPASRNQFLERIRNRVVLWVSARLSPKLKSLVEAEDVAQEVLIAVHRSLDDIRSADRRVLHKWLFRIAENRICDLADHFGARKRQLRLPLEPSQTTPGTVTMRREQVRILTEAIRRLPDDYRQVVQLKKLEGLDTPEIAERMNRSENAVRVLICRALKALRTEMA